VTFDELLPWIIIGIILAIVIILILYFVRIYNRFISLSNSSEATLGQIRVAMKKRLDMIDQLLGSVKSYARFEKETLERVTAMRAAVGQADPGDINEIEKESRSILGRLFAVAEAYPDLKTNSTVMELMSSIRGVKKEIARQRYTYNNISQQFNTLREAIPSNIVARSMGLDKLTYLEFEEGIEVPPTIEF
jgi:LemA protein